MSSCVDPRSSAPPLCESSEEARTEPVPWRLIVGLLILGQSMALGVAVNLLELDDPARRPIQAILLGSALVVTALLGGPLVVTLADRLRQGRLTVESLFLLSAGGALVVSTRSWWIGHGPVFFEVVSVILVVYGINRAILARGRRRALERCRTWSGLPERARRVVSLGEPNSDATTLETVTVSVDQLVAGDRIEIRAGEPIPIDGRLEADRVSIQESRFTGESMPVVKRRGDVVWAGTVVLEGPIIVRVERGEGQRRVDRLLDAVERARYQTPGLSASLDRVASWFTPIVAAIAGAVFAFWTWRDGWETGLLNAMAVLLTACPCALGLAAPLTVWTGLARLAEQGIMARRGDLLERLAQIDCVVFDKTGTLTEDRPRLVDWVQIGEDSPNQGGTLPPRESFRQAVALVAAGSDHPLTRGLIEAWQREEELQAVVSDAQGDGWVGGLEPDSARPGWRLIARQVHPGWGVSGSIRWDGDETSPTVEIRLGRREWVAALDDSADRFLTDSLKRDKQKKDAGPTLWISWNGRLAARATFAERVRSSWRATRDQLERLGLEVAILSGDTQERVAAVAGQGVVSWSQASPEEKLTRIADLKARGRRPLMVGDGFNDLGALTTAHVGLAVSGSTAAARHAADAQLLHDELTAIAQAVALARRTRTQLRGNLTIALGYNLVGILVASLGWIHPITAAVLMTLASATVVGRSIYAAGSEPTSFSSGEEPALREAPVPVGDTEPIEQLRDDHVTWRSRWLSVGWLAQLPIVLALADLEPLSGLTPLGIAAWLGLGWWGPRWWRNLAASRPRLDRVVGMVAVGNLGMALGWWIDLGFQSAVVAHQTGGCACLTVFEADSPSLGLGMWLGMLALGNLAMVWLRHPKRPEGSGCPTSAWVLGNVGMIAGMILGGSMAAAWAMEWQVGASHAVLLEWCGMTLGMLVWMELGHEWGANGWWGCVCGVARPPRSLSQPSVTMDQSQT